MIQDKQALKMLQIQILLHYLFPITFYNFEISLQTAYGQVYRAHHSMCNLNHSLIRFADMRIMQVLDCSRRSRIFEKNSSIFLCCSFTISKQTNIKYHAIDYR